AAERHRAPWVAELDDSSTASFREVSALLARQLTGLDRRRFRHRRDLLVKLVVGALAARSNAEASGEPGLGSRAGFTECPVTAGIARSSSLACTEESSLTIHGGQGARFAR